MFQIKSCFACALRSGKKLNIFTTPSNAPVGPAKHFYIVADISIIDRIVVLPLAIDQNHGRTSGFIATAPHQPVHGHHPPSDNTMAGHGLPAVLRTGE
jgi:hypothetical protein